MGGSVCATRGFKSPGKKLVGGGVRAKPRRESEEAMLFIGKYQCLDGRPLRSQPSHQIGGLIEAYATIIVTVNE
jgi:hypothetical protein